ncbi:GMC oxidoreductase [Aspergillus pseudodeflectus]|uniref:GMC oxidoreductase n=1 Tax=Aspergillus pseudodeflectus TaxID=176178 RepID=A0ABR4L4H8_9EURO
MNSTSDADRFDYIIVGGGLVGSVLASRLSHPDTNNSRTRVLLVEAGPAASKNEVIPHASNTAALIGSELDWRYRTVPQGNLNGRCIGNPAGKCLGGGTAINACGWTRGHHADFDQWADHVGDERYTYQNLLPYFIRTEEYHDANVMPDRHEHGSNGPVYVATPSSTGRRYPLREKLAQAWKENNVEPLLGLDGNAGCPVGLAELAESRRGGLRQLASSVYPLDGVHVLTNTLVKHILIEESATTSSQPTAVGIEAADGKEYLGGEIIAAAGSYRTRQLLMLSGIGPSEILNGLDIPIVLENPEVSRNLSDHLQLTQYWRLKDPSAGYALGSPSFSNHPEYAHGLPVDWMVTTDVPKEGLAEAIAADIGEPASLPSSNDPLLKSERSVMEHRVVYAAASATDPAIALDGSHIASTTIHLLPTSKGTVTINSTDPASDPIIDPEYLSTEVDRYAWRAGLRTTAQLFLGTETGKALIAAETPPDGFEPMGLDSDDNHLDARVRHKAFSAYHPTGTCSMGKVVDANFRVLGVSNLRVIDASVIPVPIAAHIQATVYALA